MRPNFSFFFTWNFQNFVLGWDRSTMYGDAPEFYQAIKKGLKKKFDEQNWKFLPKPKNKFTII